MGNGSDDTLKGRALYKSSSTFSSVVYALCSLAAVGLLIYSHISISGQIRATKFDFAKMLLEASEPSPSSCPPSSNLEGVFDVSMSSTIKRSFSGGAIFLGLLVLLFSGVWPYTKILLTAWCWFLPWSRATRRGTLLEWICALSRLTLFDSLAVGVFIAGLKVHVMKPVKFAINAEARFGIIAYTFAALCSLALAEWVLGRHLEAFERVRAKGTEVERKQLLGGPPGDEEEDGAADSASEGAERRWVTSRFVAELGDGRTVTLSPAGRIALPTLVLVLTGCCCASCVLPLASFKIDKNTTLGTFVDPSVLEDRTYSAVQLATSIVDPCILELSEVKVWNWAIMLLIFTFAIAVPLIGALMVFALVALPIRLEASAKLCSAIKDIRSTISLDVYWLTVVIVVLEFSDLVDGVARACPCRLYPFPYHPSQKPGLAPKCSHLGPSLSPPLR